jgi:hypothetical protein
LASRRRRRKSIGKVIVDVERRVRRVEKRPGAKRLKRNVVTTEKLGFRAVTTKVIQVDAVETENIATDAVTYNEVDFGITIVSPTEPDAEFLKDGTQWFDPSTGESQIYDAQEQTFIDLAAVDAAARAAATAAEAAAVAAQTTANGKNRIIRSTSDASGTSDGSGPYRAGDLWWKMASTSAASEVLAQYTFDGTAWRSNTLANAVIANLDAAKITTGFLAADRIQANTLDVNKLTAGELRSGTIYSGVISANQINAGVLNGITINATNGGRIGAWEIGAATVTGSSRYQALTSNILVPGDDASKLEISYTIDTSDFLITGRNSYLLYLSNSYSSITFATDSITNSSIVGRITLDAGTTSLTMGYDGQGVGSVMKLTAETVQILGSSYAVSGAKNIKSTNVAGTPTGGNDGDVVLVYT